MSTGTLSDPKHRNQLHATALITLGDMTMSNIKLYRHGDFQTAGCPTHEYPVGGPASAFHADKISSEEE